MVKILIAEDEYYSRKVLIKLLAELAEPTEVCFAAETGNAAIAYLKEHPVDIVITDIRMPEGDGLEVARFVSECCPGTTVIIQSGYSDFQYAQSAISFGVRSYLTKPLKRQELAETIKRLLAERQEKQKLGVMQEALRYLSITDIAMNPELLELFRSECQNLFDHHPYRLYLLQTASRQDEAKTDRLLTVIRQRLKDIPAFTFYFSQPDEIIVFVFDGTGENGQDRPDTRIRQILQQTPGGGAGGVSRIYQRTDQIINAYRDSIYAINNRLLSGPGQLYEYQTEMPFHQLLNKQQEVILFESILQCQYNQAAAVAAQFFAPESLKSADIYSFYSGIMQMFAIINQAYCQREPALDNQDTERYLLFSFKSDLYLYRRQEDLREYILGVIKNTCGQKAAADKHDIIAEIKAYVARNFRQDISLNELATHKYFMNPSYLSRLFKAETGANFSKYLICYRMERAKELLGKTGFKVSEIADLVGYNDPSYFIQTFKKQFDMTPEQYRVQIREAEVL